MRSSLAQIRGMRVFALLVDLGLAGAAAQLVGWLVSWLASRIGGPPSATVVIAIWAPVMAAMAAALLLRDFRSPGRRLMGLRVVALDGRPVRVWQSMARNAAALVPGWNLREWVAMGHGAGQRPVDRWTGTRVDETFSSEDR